MSVTVATLSRAAVLPEHATRALVLRQELKEWEAIFALENGGRKATREEIKGNAGVAAKYSEYRRLREGSSIGGEANGGPDISTNDQPPTTASPSRKRPRDIPITTHPQRDTTKPQTPRKSRSSHSRRNTNQIDKQRAAMQEFTPVKRHTKSANLGIEDSENIPPPPAFIGPTPQKDGRVLGLFDLLSPIAKMHTPTKARVVLGITTGRNTPKKEHRNATIFGKSPGVSLQGVEDLTNTGHKHTRSPQSASKRYLLDTFVTPSKRRRLEDLVTTPTSISRGNATADVGFATPAFLRRQSSLQVLPAVAEDEIDHEDGGFGLAVGNMTPSRPTQAKWLKRRSEGSGLVRTRSTGIGRSLSTMIAEMRQVEEDRLDEEMDLLREMEGETITKPPTISRPMNNGHHTTQRENSRKANEPPSDESQIQNTEEDLKLLGPDRAANESDEEDFTGEGVGRDGRPLRVWKKKGMKRQTRKVLLRPNTRKPQPTADTNPNTNDTSQPIDIVAESQFPDPASRPPSPPPDSPSLSSSETEEQQEEEKDTATLSEDDDDEGYTSTSTSTTTSPSQTPHHTRKPRATKSTTKPTTTTTSKPTLPPTTTQTSPEEKEKEKENKKENPIKKAAKKISATAHANFRRLKIRSAKGAAGAKAGGGRFGGRGRR